MMRITTSGPWACMAEPLSRLFRNEPERTVPEDLVLGPAVVVDEFAGQRREAVRLDHVAGGEDLALRHGRGQVLQHLARGIGVLGREPAEREVGLSELRHAERVAEVAGARLPLVGFEDDAQMVADLEAPVVLDRLEVLARPPRSEEPRV